MPRNLLTLGLFLLSSTAALAQSETYTVKSGDTISSIAARCGASQRSIIAANGLTNSHRLKLGQKIRIPSGKSSGITISSKASAKGGYAVREGEVDWTIAKKHGLTLAQLHRLNPGVRWNAIQVGQHLNVGGKAAPAPVAKSVVKGGGAYTIRTGDNDWTIASRLGVSAKTLRALNPSVNWDRLQIGTNISVPGVAKVATAGVQIKSRTVAVKGED
ncbi:LysM peptidoglycan-binding domain-containing protein, partial [bacterium]